MKLLSYCFKFGTMCFDALKCTVGLAISYKPFPDDSCEPKKIYIYMPVDGMGRK